jgi:hypothetical protein
VIFGIKKRFIRHGRDAKNDYRVDRETAKSIMKEMLIQKPQVHILTKEVRLASGELVRAYFAVIDNNGVRDVKFLGTKPIESETVASQPQVLLLDCPKCKVFHETPIVSPFEKISHYFSLDLLVHQLARAPSRA